MVGLLINDSRNPQRQVTIIAERGAFVDSPAGSRIVMVNGNRQQFDADTRKLSLLTFDSYTLDLDTLHDAPVVRFREAQERFLDELFSPPRRRRQLIAPRVSSSRRISAFSSHYRRSAFL